MLRRALLAAAASDHIRELAAATPEARAFADRFVAGDSIADVIAVVRRLRADGLLVTLDYLGGSATETAAHYVTLLGELSAAGLTAGGAVEVSVRPGAVGLPHDQWLAAGQVTRIASAAADHGTTVTLDAGDHRTAEATLNLAAGVRETIPSVGSVVQAALRRTETDVRSLTRPGVRVRLVKGEYAEPVSEAFTTRHDVDKAFARCVRTLMTGPGYPMIATHDPRLLAITRSLGLRRPADSFEYQMLFGVRDDLARAMASSGARVRLSVPYGPGRYEYLVRRLTEHPDMLTSYFRALRTR